MYHRQIPVTGNEEESQGGSTSQKLRYGTLIKEIESFNTSCHALPVFITIGTDDFQNKPSRETENERKKNRRSNLTTSKAHQQETFSSISNFIDWGTGDDLLPLYCTAGTRVHKHAGMFSY